MTYKTEIEFEIGETEYLEIFVSEMSERYADNFIEESYFFHALQIGLKRFNKDNDFLDSIISHIDCIVGLEKLEKAIVDYKKEYGEE